MAASGWRTGPERVISLGMLNLLLWSVVASAAPCEAVGVGDLLAVRGPAVVVLGERRGSQPDLARAARLVRRLADRGPVTLALDAVPASGQRALDALADGELDANSLRDALAWDVATRPFEPYQPLLGASRWGVDVLAAGFEGAAAPTGRRFPIPEGYAAALHDAMGEHPVSPELQDRFERGLAWQDNRTAQLAQQGWQREGVLVVIADRARVEGGLGVSWQLEALLPGVPVQRVLLDDGGDPVCAVGDQVWMTPGESLVKRVHTALHASR